VIDVNALRLTAAGLLVATAALIAVELPELKRYVKMMRM
jgi:biopolymer transport protein ExbB/TolQ